MATTENTETPASTAGEFDGVADGLRQAVPFVRTLGLEFLEISLTRAVLRLPDEAAHHNHLGGPHAGALFTLAESASGALVITNFGPMLDRYTPLAVRAEIRYLKLAMGPITAEATLGADAQGVTERLEAGEKPEFTVDITMRREDGTPTTEMTVIWALRPARMAP